MISDIETWLWKSKFCNIHGKFIIGRWSAKDLLKWESAYFYFYSINTGFDAEFAGNS